MAMSRPLSKELRSVFQQHQLQVDNSQLFGASDVTENSHFLDTNEEQVAHTETFSQPILGKRTSEEVDNKNNSSTKSSKRKKTDFANQQLGEATCKWDDCNESFASLSMLGCHLTDHIKQQKTQNRSNKRSGYLCKWKDCKRTTPFKGCYNLEHHLRYQHTGEKPFQCKYCSSSFAQRSDMTEHLYNIHNRKPTKKQRGRNKSQTTLYTNYTPPNDKVQQLMMPRSRPIPILPAPQQISYLDYPHCTQAVASGQLRQSSIMPNDPGFFFPIGRFCPKYVTNDTDSNFSTTQFTDSDSESYLMNLPFYPGYPSFLPGNASNLSSSVRATSNPMSFSGEYNDSSMDGLAGLSFFANHHSSWMDHHGEESSPSPP